MGDLTIDDFAGWVGRECDVTAPENEVRMTLVTAEPLVIFPQTARFETVATFVRGCGPGGA